MIPTCTPVCDSSWVGCRAYIPDGYTERSLTSILMISFRVRLLFYSWLSDEINYDGLLFLLLILMTQNETFSLLYCFVFNEFY